MCFFQLLSHIDPTTLTPTLPLQLGIDPTASNLTQQDPWDALVGRVKYLFSDEVGYPHSLHFFMAGSRIYWII